MMKIVGKVFSPKVLEVQQEVYLNAFCCSINKRKDSHLLFISVSVLFCACLSEATYDPQCPNKHLRSLCFKRISTAMTTPHGDAGLFISW